MKCNKCIEKRYTFKCNNCNHTGCSQHLLGGDAIPEEGDYNDLVCPNCASVDIDDENYIGDGCKDGSGYGEVTHTCEQCKKTYTIWELSDGICIDCALGDTWDEEIRDMEYNKLLKMPYLYRKVILDTIKRWQDIAAALKANPELDSKYDMPGDTSNDNPLCIEYISNCWTCPYSVFYGKKCTTKGKGIKKDMHFLEYLLNPNEYTANEISNACVMMLL